MGSCAVLVIKGGGIYDRMIAHSAAQSPKGRCQRQRHKASFPSPQCHWGIGYPYCQFAIDPKSGILLLK